MKRKFQFRSVRTRLTFWFLLVAVVPLLVVSVIIYYQRVEVIKSARFDRLMAIRDLKVSHVNDWLDERLGDVRTIAGDYEVRGSLTAPGSTPVNRWYSRRASLSVIPEIASATVRIRSSVGIA